MVKSKIVQTRITEVLKDKFKEKLEKDGITESDFLTACIMNYLEIKTIPKKNIGGSNDE